MKHLARKLVFLSFLLVLLVSCQNRAAAQGLVVYRLVDVQTIYLDENSFKIKSSSCGRVYSGIFLPCDNERRDREKFLIALKRWLGKYGFTVIADKAGADAVLQGDISMDNNSDRRKFGSGRRDSKKKDKDYQSEYYEPSWSVNAWLENQDGDKLWINDGSYVPEVSYKPSGLAKIEAKKLARAIQYNYQKGK